MSCRGPVTGQALPQWLWGPSSAPARASRPPFDSLRGHPGSAPRRSGTTFSRAGLSFHGVCDGQTPHQPAAERFPTGEPTPSPVVGHGSAPASPPVVWGPGLTAMVGAVEGACARRSVHRWAPIPARPGAGPRTLCPGAPGREGRVRAAHRVEVRAGWAEGAKLQAPALSASLAPCSAPEACTEARGCEDSCPPSALFFGTPRPRSHSPRNPLLLPGRGLVLTPGRLVPQEYQCHSVAAPDLPALGTRPSHSLLPAATRGHSLGSSPRPTRRGPGRLPRPHPLRLALTSLPEGAAPTARHTSRGCSGRIGEGGVLSAVIAASRERGSQLHREPGRQAAPAQCPKMGGVRPHPAPAPASHDPRPGPEPARWRPDKPLWPSLLCTLPDSPWSLQPAEGLHGLKGQWPELSLPPYSGQLGACCLAALGQESDAHAPFRWSGPGQGPRAPLSTPRCPGSSCQREGRAPSLLSIGLIAGLHGLSLSLPWGAVLGEGLQPGTSPALRVPCL